jgi:septum formation inhibitor-activating ATPase MinD
VRRKLTEKLEAAKELYREKDKLVDEILELGLDKVELEDFTMTVVDCFAGKNKKFKPAAFSRFDLAFAKKGGSGMIAVDEIKKQTENGPL